MQASSPSPKRAPSRSPRNDQVGSKRRTRTGLRYRGSHRSCNGSAARKPPGVRPRAVGGHERSGAHLLLRDLGGGRYLRATGLRGGSYDVLFFGGGNFASQAYNDKSKAVEAEPVAVSAGGSISGINAALASGEGPSSVGSEPSGSTTGTGLLPSTGPPRGIGGRPGLSLASRQILPRANDVGIVKLTCVGTARCRSQLTLTLRRPVRGRPGYGVRSSSLSSSSSPCAESFGSGPIESEHGRALPLESRRHCTRCAPRLHCSGPSAKTGVRVRSVILETQTGRRG